MVLLLVAVKVKKRKTKTRKRSEFSKKNKLFHTSKINTHGYTRMRPSLNFLSSLLQRRLVDRRKQPRRLRKLISTRRNRHYWKKTELLRMLMILIVFSSLLRTTLPCGRSTWPSSCTRQRWTRQGTSHRELSRQYHTGVCITNVLKFYYF